MQRLKHKPTCKNCVFELPFFAGQVPAGRSDAHPGQQKHPVQTGGHLSWGRVARRDAQQSGEPHGCPAATLQRGPLLRGEKFTFAVEVYFSPIGNHAT